MTRDSRPAILITGAGSGIGRALAHEAASDGWHVILVGRTRATLEDTATLIGAGDATVLPADITRADDRARIAEAVGARLDVLVNNAGTLRAGRLTDLPDDAATAMISTNLLAPILLTRDLIPALRAARGRVVNIGSVFGDIAFPYFSVYSASKFALRGLSDALRRELAEDGISVSYIAPRATRTAAEVEFAALVEPFSMVLDPADKVAARAWRGIRAGRRTVYPGLAERVFVTLQALAPRLIDRALIKQARAPEAKAALSTLPENAKN